MAEHEILVFRVVDRNRRGMYHYYSSRPSLWDLCSNEYCRQYHPIPQEDGIFGITDDHRFGFQSPEQLKKWTKSVDVRKKMREHGGKIRVYTVPVSKTKVGKNQVAFVLKYARLINIFEVDHYD